MRRSRPRGATPAEDAALSGTSLREVLAGTTADRPTYFESMTYNLVRGWAPLRGVLVGRGVRAERVASSSNFGPWSYEALDTKLARHAKPAPTVCPCRKRW